jgi:hypothetical protein
MVDKIIKAVVFKEDGLWVAQALEIDLASFGVTCDSTIENIRDALNAMILENHEDFDDYKKAHEEYWVLKESCLDSREIQMVKGWVLNALILNQLI